MGIEAKFVVTIVKKCDGCGLSYEATGKFSHAAAVLAFGGPVEAAAWQGGRSCDKMMRNVWEYARELRQREGSEVVIQTADGQTLEFESTYD